MTEPMPLAVEVRGVTKAFGPIVALDEVSFALRSGEIHALVGHNGAGKSTLVKVLAGVVSPDRGEVMVGGKPMVLRSPRQAQAAGIAVVEQELSLVPSLTVLDNILLGRVDAGAHSRGAFLDRIRGLLSQLGLSNVRLGTVVEDLSMAERQLVEIARALSRDARILILDEPTATLGEREIERVFAGVRKLVAEGRSVIFVSHRLGEVLALCSQVTVLRDGRMIASRPAAELSRDSIVKLMLGEVSEKSDVRVRDGGVREGLVVIDGLSVPGQVEDFALRANGGEIVAIAGQVGSGASEVLRALGGLIPDARGRVTIAGRPMRLGAPQRSIRGGAVFASNDRKGEGLFLHQSVARNLLATRLKAVSRGGFVSRREFTALAQRLAGLIGFDRKRLGAAAETLSGGNQQKVFLGRCIEQQAAVLLLFDEPTRGVDVGGRADIHNLVRHAASTGACIIFVSSELDEILDLADTVVTMFSGRITRIGRRREMTAAGILAEITSGTATATVA
ncbi:MAG TPA: sugar ABC transporter ATP-binding protein [Bauldia sp.]|nr:sugar ABC transporter ATP-binding protein [Bauldia sp.]